MAAPKFSKDRAAQIRSRAEGQLSAKASKASKDTFTMGTRSPASSNAARSRPLLGGGGVRRDKNGRFT